MIIPPRNIPLCLVQIPLILSLEYLLTIPQFLPSPSFYFLAYEVFFSRRCSAKTHDTHQPPGVRRQLFTYCISDFAPKLANIVNLLTWPSQSACDYKLSSQHGIFISSRCKTTINCSQLLHTTLKQ